MMHQAVLDGSRDKSPCTALVLAVITLSGLSLFRKVKYPMSLHLTH